MFTGIITDKGRIRAIQERGDRRFVFATGLDTGAIDVGSSIACSGPCLTVVERGPGWFAADVSGETLSKTTLASWRVGTEVNFERALRVGDELGGHLVTGHVDGVAELRERRTEGDSLRCLFAAAEPLQRPIAAKGSVTLDGVSLTVNHVGAHGFGINIIPHTARVTTLGALKPGALVNLEIDLLARYVQRLLGKEG